MADKQSIKVEEEEETETTTTIPKEPELPPEVDAFFKGKNKYKHPYGDWRPVVKADPLKRFASMSLLILIARFFFLQ
jgi:hypothetical protein